ncbi:hypothetical protein ACVWZL_003304 [Bradyrhizobium sp. GM2.4]
MTTTNLQLPVSTLSYVWGEDSGGLGGKALVTQANVTAVVDPSSANDSSQGYSVGSLWQNQNTGRVWIARSVGVGVAVWTLLALADHPGYIASNWYLPSGPFRVSGSATAPGLGSIRLFPGFIKERVTLAALGVRVATTSAGGNVQAAIYANNKSTMRPTGNALASTASMSTASAASVNAAVSVQVEPGMYWFATNCDNITAAFGCLDGNGTSMAQLVGSPTQSNNLVGTSGAIDGLSVAQTFGTWPDLTSGSFTELVGANSIPLVQFQVTSIP